MILSFLFSVALATTMPPQSPSPVPPFLAFEFGNHAMETVVLEQRTVSGRKMWVGRYLVGPRIMSERALTEAMVKDLDQKLKSVIDGNRKEIPTLADGCTSRIIYRKPKKSESFCADKASVLANTRVSEWIREAQAVLGVRPMN